eukprot:Sspe_Gene.69626::Locus_41053_Transcript_1_1_Confidence_1.000_Length_1675::g.69626::m.69626
MRRVTAVLLALVVGVVARDLGEVWEKLQDLERKLKASTNKAEAKRLHKEFQEKVTEFKLAIQAAPKHRVLPDEFTFDPRMAMYWADGNVKTVVPCGSPLGSEGECCGDGVCQYPEAYHNCPADCSTADQHILVNGQGKVLYNLRQRRLLSAQESTLFGPLEATEHYEYHCAKAYEAENAKIRWELDRPSHDLVEFLKSDGAPALPGVAIDLGSGWGRDTRHLASAGYNATGVDVSPIAVQQGLKLAGELLSDDALDRFELVAYDALQLPVPKAPVDLIWDNTVYCNLRLEYIGNVTAMLSRLVTPGRTLYLLNCGNGDRPGMTEGHPRPTKEAIERELSGIFEVVWGKEGVYDMDLGSVDEWKDKAKAVGISEDEVKRQVKQGGVPSWTYLFRAKPRSTETDDSEL